MSPSFHVPQPDSRLTSPPRRWMHLLLLACCLSALSPGLLRADFAPSPASAPSSQVLILHDSSGPAGWIGEMHGLMLANLLGHFSLDHRLKPVEDYQAGDVDRHHSVFYFGTVYSNTLPAVFLQDIRQTQTTVCWFKYNWWDLVGTETNQFVDQYGFRFDYMDASGFDEILYQGESFSKNLLDPDLGRVSLLDPVKTSVLAEARRSLDGQTLPYILQSANFFYVADSPFTYIAEEDRYVIFADALHDILGIDHPPQHHAIVRLEDIDPNYPTNLLYRTADLLQEENVPFAFSVIPVHVDPAGLYNDGVPRRLELAANPVFAQALQYMTAQGGQLVLHGYTHQYRSAPNPYSGVSGDDFEFYRVALNADDRISLFQPVAEDSELWVQSRLEAARDQLQRTGLSAVAWETPHYTASPLDYRVFAATFPVTTQRVLYRGSQGHTAGQFFPYAIGRDVYGQYIIPENLGNLRSPSASPPSPGRTVEDILRAARKARVVRDGWANAYFHLFLNLDDLRRLVRGIRDLGYTYVPLTANPPPSVTQQPTRAHAWPGEEVVLHAQVNGQEPMSRQWFFNGHPLPGATNDTLRLDSLTPSRLGTYTLHLSNGFGSTTSLPVTTRFLKTPRLTGYLLSPAGMTVSFLGETGLYYYVDYQDRLPAASWTATFPVVGQGFATNILAPRGGLGQRFYRLRVD